MQSPAQQFVLAISITTVLLAATAPMSGHEFDTKSAWMPEVEELYRPDVQHSQSAATNALARDLAHEMTGAENVVFRLRCADDALCVQVAQALEKAGLSHGPEGATTLVAHISSGDNLEQSVRFRVVDRGIELTARFVTKPWVSAVPEGSFTVVRGLAAGDLVGKSRDVIAQAIDTEILPRVRQHAGKKRLPSSSWANKLVRRRVEELLEDSPIVVDRFRQTFYTSIDGEQHVALVREAVLLDLNEDNLQRIMQPVIRDLHRARRRWSVAIGISAVAMASVLLVCCIGYTFFNRITQGYYVWPIRFATAVLLVMSVTVAARLLFR